MRTSTHDEAVTGPGRRLGSRYVLEHVVGRGATGEVWRAHDERGATVAVKVLRPELVDDPEVVARFIRERHIVRSVRDEHVVGVHDLVIEGETLAIVMDHVEGPDLHTHVRDGDGLAPGAAVAVVRQLLQGLAAIHRAGVVHRDVKPANVLVDAHEPDAPVVELTDFGLSRLLDGASVTRTTGVVGTPRYMAPELGDGHEPTPASDLYAVGVILYELLADRPPIVATNPVAMLRAHAEQEVPRPDAIPDAVWEVMSTLLAKRPEDRYADADTARAALDEVKPDVDTMKRRVDAEPEVVTLQPAAVTPHVDARPTILPNRPLSRRAQLVAAITAAVLIGVGVGAFAATRSVHHVESLGWQDSYRGYVVKRYWWLSGRHRDTFHALEQIQPTATMAVGARYLLVVPKQLAARDVDVVFSGTRPRVEERDPAFGVDLGGLSSAGELDVRYSIEVAPGGDAAQRLRRWNADLHDARLRLRQTQPRLAVEIPRTTTVEPRAVSALVRHADALQAAAPGHARAGAGGPSTGTSIGPGGGTTALSTLDASTAGLTIRQYQTGTLTLRGTMDDHTAAAAPVLATTACTLDDPSIGTCRVAAGPDATGATVSVVGARVGHTHATLANSGASTGFDVSVASVLAPPPATLVHLRFSVPSVALAAPGSGVATVTLAGDMSDGSPAPARVLGASVVVAADPALVAVSVVGGAPDDTAITVALSAVAPGATTVTATSGPVQADLAVTVARAATTETAGALSGVTLTPAAPVDATAAFGHAWLSVTSICWDFTFGLDPLDPADGALTVGGFDSFTAPGPGPSTSAEVCAPSGADLSAFTGGTVGAPLSLAAGAVDLATVTVTVVGVPA